MLRRFIGAVLPSMLAFAFSGLYTIVDGFFIGRNIGDIGLAAVNIAYPLAALVQAVGTGIGMGGAVWISLYRGKGDREREEECLGNTLTTLFLGGLLLMAVLFALCGPVLRLSGAEGSVYGEAMVYIRILIGGSLLQLFATGFAPLIRNYEGAVTAMGSMIGGFLTNILLDFLFVAVYHKGVAGAAAATVIGQGVTVVPCILFMGARIKGIRKEHFLLKKKQMLRIAGTGVSPFGLTISPFIVIMLINRSAYVYGGEAAVPFFSISGSEFVEMFVGVGAGRTRGVGGHDESEQTLNQLLTEMDGFDSSVGLIILAATNRPEILDQALLRAGRFDRQVLVDRPDKKGRLDILKVHVKKVTLAQDVDLEQVAALTTGFSGADLANRVNEAALAARRRRASAVELQDFTATIERIVAGLEKKSRVLNPKERETVAHHEMGHALVALALPETDPVHKISIIPRGIGALGYTLQRPTEDRFLMTRTDLEHKIAVLLGGRAAEKLVFGELSTGAADDLARATDIARDMITRFGMDEGLGYIAFEAQRPRFLDTPELAHGGCRVAESTQARIDQAIRDIVMGVFERAYRILDINRAVLERCARELLARETLDESDIRQLTQGLVRN